jgi:hypothetical protein
MGNNYNNRSSKTYELLIKVLEDTALSKLDKLVFLALITFNGKDKIFPSLQAICSRIKSTREGSISKSLNKLKKFGYISIKRRYQKSNIYKINGIPALETDIKNKSSAASPGEDEEFERAKFFLERQQKIREERNAIQRR